MARKWVRRLGRGLAIVVGLIVISAVGWVAWFNYSLSAENAAFVYDDLRRFARVIEDDGSLQERLAEGYFGPSSQGLSAYAGQYRLDPERLAAAVEKRPAFYRSLPRLFERIEGQQSQTRVALARLESLFPRAVFPPVYYLVGAIQAGGANSYPGVMVAVEVYADDPSVDSSDLATFQPWPVDRLPYLVTHEMVHFNQMMWSPLAYISDNSNLARAIKEGAADFLAELAAGGHINPRAHAYGMTHERELWAEFSRVMHSHETGDWFWVEPGGERPADLGYFLGYRIVQSWYERQHDRTEAVAGIIGISDYDAFLRESGYSP